MKLALFVAFSFTTPFINCEAHFWRRSVSDGGDRNYSIQLWRFSVAPRGDGVGDAAEEMLE
jgi:hypothetical protein